MEQRNGAVRCQSTPMASAGIGGLGQLVTDLAAQLGSEMVRDMLTTGDIPLQIGIDSHETGVDDKQPYAGTEIKDAEFEIIEEDENAP